MINLSLKNITIELKMKKLFTLYHVKGWFFGMVETETHCEELPSYKLNSSPFSPICISN